MKSNMISKEVLRNAVRLELIRRGFSVSLHPGPGIVPGARLLAKKGNRVEIISIKTSTDREFGMLRKASGDWRNLSSINLLIVALPSIVRAGVVDIYAFNPKRIKFVFDLLIASREADGRNDNYKAPVFVSIDHRVQYAKRTFQLTEKSIWRASVQQPLLLGNATVGGKDQLVLQFKEQLADLLQISPSSIRIEITIEC